MKNMVKACALGGACLVSANAGYGQSLTANDPFYQTSLLHGQLGVGLTFNSINGPLTVLNNTSTTAISTDILDFGTHGRAGLELSNPIGNDRRIIVSIDGMRGDETTRTQDPNDTSYPGIYDDGFRFPPGSIADHEIVARTLTVSVLHEWATSETWRLRAGVKGGSVSQDIRGSLTFGGFDPIPITSTSDNRFLGVVGGVSHYSKLGNGIGLRLTGDVGIAANQFDFTFGHQPAFGPASTVAASASGTSYSSNISAQLEKTLASGALLTLELGVESYYNVGSGIETLLNPAGTATAAAIKTTTMSNAFINIGFATTF